MNRNKLRLWLSLVVMCASGLVLVLLSLKIGSVGWTTSDQATFGFALITTLLAAIMVRGSFSWPEAQASRLNTLRLVLSLIVMASASVVLGLHLQQAVAAGLKATDPLALGSSGLTIILAGLMAWSAFKGNRR